MQPAQRLFAALVLCAAAISSTCVSVLAARIIYPNQHWTDTNGNRIEAHGGGFLFVASENKYFWYGESQKNDDLRSHGVTAYSSDSLAGPWKYEGMMLRNSDITVCCGPFVVERPKVLFNAATKMYVMWFHLDNNSYNMRNAGIATSSSPRGPFKFVRGFRPDGIAAMDMALYLDDDGQAYFARNVDTQYVAISKLRADYLDTMGVLSKASNFEAIAMIRLPVSRQLFVIGSGLTGWAPNSMQLYHSATGSLANPNWQFQGNPTGSGSSFNSQPTFLYPMTDRCGKLFYIYMGDNWVYCGAPGRQDLFNACYVWLPFAVNEEGTQMQSIPNRSSWDLDDPFNQYGSSAACPPRVQASDKCGAATEKSDLTLTCPMGGVVSAVDFASYGNPSGTCNSLSLGTCHANSSRSVVEGACLGQPRCTVSATNAQFGGDPCSSVNKILAAQVACSSCGTASEGQSVALSCGAATITGVGFASYGTPIGSCYGASWSTGSCHASSSSAVVQSACVGKTACTVQADKSSFGEPCSGTGKMLAASVSCSSCGTAGEGGSVKLSCASGVITGVAFASYGQPSGSCSTRFVKGNCHADSSLSVVQKACVGKSSCSVSAANSVFQDPCGGSGKTLAVSVLCGASVTPPTGQCVQVSENENAVLQCASGNIARITFASYGSPDGNCGMGSCHASNSLSVVQQACVGKPSCSVSASNSVFGDPCSGVGKALAVSYTCA